MVVQKSPYLSVSPCAMVSYREGCTALYLNLCTLLRTQCAMCTGPLPGRGSPLSLPPGTSCPGRILGPTDFLAGATGGRGGVPDNTGCAAVCRAYCGKLYHAMQDNTGYKTPCRILLYSTEHEVLNCMSQHCYTGGEAQGTVIVTYS